MMHVSLVSNSGYKWLQSNGIAFKGSFFSRDVLYRGDDAIRFLAAIKSYDELLETLKGMNGNFSLVCQKENTLWAAVDIARSMPLFYAGRNVSDSAEALRHLLGIDKSAVDELLLLEQMLTSYNMFDHTVYQAIHQLDLGQALCISDETCRTDYYYRHVRPINEIEYTEALKNFSSATSNAFDRLKKQISGRPVALALSGGYDSRYVACMLKEKGIGNVICYTYGRNDSFEVEISKKTAASLGFQWHCVEYSKEKLQGVFPEQINDFIMMSHNHSTLVHLQDILAIKELTARGVIPENAVFITGYCGDLPAGSFALTNEYKKFVEFNADFLARAFFEDNSLYDIAETFKAPFIERIKQELAGYPISVENYQTFVSVFDCIFTSSRPSKYVVNANRAYEYVGHEWLMPLWDNELLDFWYSLPVKYRAGQKLYIDWLMNGAFKKYHIDMKKNISHAPPWYIGKTTLKTKIKRAMAGLGIRVCYMTGLWPKRSFDVNGFDYVALNYYRRIKNKHLINYSRANIVLILSLYFCEILYGPETVAKMKKYLK